MISTLDKLKNHPLHSYLGVIDIISDNKSTKLHAIVNKNTVNFGGVYHGGVLYTLCDVCAYANLAHLLEENTEAVTHDIHVSLLKPALPNQNIIYESTIRKMGKNICFIDVEARAEDKVIATARVTKSIIAKNRS